MKVTKSQLKELIKQALVSELQVFGSKAQYDAYKKKTKIKPGTKVKVDGKITTVRGPSDSKMSKSAKATADRMADKLNKRMADLEKKRKQGKIKESKKRRFTVKEVRMWMKKLEENRYKRVYNSDARRVAWMVNNEGVSLDEMPMSMKKKWTKAQYGRERYLAKEFLQSKSEQLSEAISGADRKTLLVFVREIIQNLKKAGAKKPSKAIGRGVLSIMRAMTYTPDNANYKQYKKYFPKKYNSKLVQKHLKNFHNQNDKVQVTLVQQAMNNVLGEGALREQIRESIREKLNEGKLQTQFEIPTREQRKVMTILRKAKYKEGRDYDFGAARGPKFVLEVPRKLENKILSLLIQKDVRNIHEI